MATKKKVTIEVTTGEDAPVSLSYNPDTQKILDHFGENSAEYAEAKAESEEVK